MKLEILLEWSPDYLRSYQAPTFLSLPVDLSLVHKGLLSPGYLMTVGLWPNMVHNILPQNMVSWHTEYLKLKEFDKLYPQERLSDLLLPGSRSKDLHLGGALPKPRGKEHPLSGDKGMLRGIQMNRPCCFP